MAIKNSWASFRRLQFSCNSTIISHLLLVACEVVGVGPDHVEQLVGGEGGLQAGEKFLNVTDLRQ